MRYASIALAAATIPLAACQILGGFTDILLADESSGTSAPADASTEGAPLDASSNGAGDALSDATPGGGDAVDAPSDATPGGGDAASPQDAAVSCPVASPCVPAGSLPTSTANVARCATATERYGSVTAGAGELVDGDLATYWRTAFVQACPLGTCSGLSTQLVLDAPRSVATVKLFGSRSGDTDDILTANVMLLDSQDNVLYEETVTTSRGIEPNGDAVVHVTPIVSCVSKVRMVPLTTESNHPRMAEIEVYETAP